MSHHRRRQRSKAPRRPTECTSWVQGAADTGFIGGGAIFGWYHVRAAATCESFLFEVEMDVIRCPREASDRARERVHIRRLVGLWAHLVAVAAAILWVAAAHLVHTWSEDEPAAASATKQEVDGSVTFGVGTA